MGDKVSVQYFVVPSSGDIFLRADDLVKWLDEVRETYPHLVEAANLMETKVKNLKISAANHNKKIAATTKLEKSG